MMKLAVKPDLESKNFYPRNSYISIRETKIRDVDYKFYQKIFVVLISLSTILIFPESPKELENICENHNSRDLCNVW